MQQKRRMFSLRLCACGTLGLFAPLPFGSSILQRVVAETKRVSCVASYYSSCSSPPQRRFPRSPARECPQTRTRAGRCPVPFLQSLRVTRQVAASASAKVSPSVSASDEACLSAKVSHLSLFPTKRRFSQRTEWLASAEPSLRRSNASNRTRIHRSR